jgi:ubiquinone biosynthesis monooxygenase Coq7
MVRKEYSSVDWLIMGLDQALETVFGKPRVTERANPATDVLDDSSMSTKERRHVARLMRINHTGEVCAQALYQGQALTARDPLVRKSMERSAQEENDHLDWCETRIHELGGRTSLLNPFWYAGSFLMGATAGAVGDKWSLGFVAETEYQVESHLDEHLAQVPDDDQRTRRILEQMKADELSHADKAIAQGAATLPTPIRQAMKLLSKVMTTTVYRL